jgi:predicted RecB family nuclease
MKQDDLSQVKYIGASRMKILNELGITTIEQLHEMPLKKLAEIKSIGEHYAKLIKNSVTECYTKKDEKLPEKIVSAKEKKILEVNQDLLKTIKSLKKSLNRVNENLKPLWRKKYLESYVSFKNRSNKLKARLNEINKIHKELPKKDNKKIVKKGGALNLFLKKVGKKPQKKKYKKITQEIQSFSRMLRDIIS